MGTAGAPLSPQSQLLSQTQAFKTNASGAATITFPNPPQGFTWTGTLNCATATTGAVFVASVGAVSWGEWGGNSVYGPVQVLGAGSQQLVVTVTGLQANTNYVLQWNGSSDPSDTVAAVWPDANSTALTAQISGTVPVTIGTPVSIVPVQHQVVNAYITTSQAAPYSQSLAITATDQSLYLQLSSIVASGGFPTQGFFITVVGNSTGDTYLTQNVTTSGSLLNLQCQVWGFIETVTLNITIPNPSTGSIISMNVLAVASSANFAANPVQVTNQLNPNGLAQPLLNLPYGTVYQLSSTSGTLPRTPSLTIPPQSTINQVVALFTNPVAGTTYTATWNGNFEGQFVESVTCVTGGAGTSLAIRLPVALGYNATSATLTNLVLSSSTGASIAVVVYGLTVSNLYQPAPNPGLPQDQVTYGGLQVAFTNAVTTTSPGVSLLAAPAAGTAYRLHSWCINTLPTAGSVRLWSGAGATGTFGAMFTNSVGTQYLGGILTTQAVYVYGPSLTPTTVGACLFYDVVQQPQIY